jgi:hypothetical protein
MANPGRDFANATFDDVLLPKRQREIEDLVARLAEFKPTRVALEYTPDRDSLMNARYAAYRAGTHVLGKSESEQVGFRLAAKLGLSRVHGIDHHRDLDMGAVMQAAGANGQMAFMGWLQQGIASMMAQVQREMHSLTITGILAAMNQPEREATMHSLYLRATVVGRDSAYTGAAMTEDWYGRNLRILANIYRITTQPQDRVLVLIGAGHTPILERMISDAGEWQLVDPLPLLRTP